MQDGMPVMQQYSRTKVYRFLRDYMEYYLILSPREVIYREIIVLGDSQLIILLPPSDAYIIYNESGRAG